MLVAPGPITFPNNAALAEGLRVKLSAGFLVAAGAADDELGTLERIALATDTTAAVLPIDHPGVRHMICSEAITLYATVYAAASGKIATSGTLIRGIALEAGSGNNSVIKVMTVRSSITGTVARANLVEDALQPYPLVLESWYIWDSTTHAPLGATAISADDLIYTLGTLGTSEPTITATDFGGTSATQYARLRIALPAEYVAGQAIKIKVNALTATTVADASSDIDFEVYRAVAPTVDICATVPQSINSLTAVDVEFTITPTDCVPGDVLDIRMKYAGVDGGNLGVITPTIKSVTLLLDIKG